MFIFIYSHTGTDAPMLVKGNIKCESSVMRVDQVSLRNNANFVKCLTFPVSDRHLKHRNSERPTGMEGWRCWSFPGCRVRALHLLDH